VEKFVLIKKKQYLCTQNKTKAKKMNSMKRLFTIVIMAGLLTASAAAQEKHSAWTLNTRAWCTNYFTTLIGGTAEFLIKEVLRDSNESDSLLWERIVPDVGLVFPIGMQKSGFSDGNNIYGPYHYAFGNPFKHIGDYAVGLDASWKDKSPIGFYAGTYFKSQEVVFKDFDNIRGYYIQPRAGIILGGQRKNIEAGAFYDIVTGCTVGGESADKSQLKSGVGLDFAFSSLNSKGNCMYILQFSMPLHNFFDSDVMKRKVGYIMLTQRVTL